MKDRKKAIVGCILGTAVGDSLGLPYEGLRPRRGAKLLGPPDRQRLLFGHGMVSDDTEHTLFVVRSLVASRFDPGHFERQLASALRWWVAGLPAGVGLATLRAVCKLWLGFPPRRSGIFSAGNGPAMRSAVLGVVFGENSEVLSDWVLRTTRLTHTDPKAFFGAFTVALAAHVSAQAGDIQPRHFVAIVKRALAKHASAEYVQLLYTAAASAEANQCVGEFADAIGSRNGISGYMYHTVPCVIQTWLRHQDDFAGGLQEIVTAGGDTDTSGAILGAILGARAGKAGIPEAWYTRILEWPRTTAWMEQMGHCLAKTVDGDEPVRCPGYFTPGILPRNLFFLGIVLFHGFRRLAPPY